MNFWTIFWTCAKSGYVKLYNRFLVSDVKLHYQDIKIDFRPIRDDLNAIVALQTYFQIVILYFWTCVMGSKTLCKPL